MVIKVRGNNIAVYIVCRVLYRGEFLNFLPLWKNNDSSRVLPCCTAHSRTALDNPVDLAVAFMDAALLKIILHITEGCFFCKRTDGSCLKSLSLSENNLCVTMSVSLIFS